MRSHGESTAATGDAASAHTQCTKAKRFRWVSYPPWLWLLLIGGFAIIFYLFMPKPETAVDYNPWFLDQVESNNIKKMSVQANEVRGELREDKPYQSGTSPNSVLVHKFITYFPSDQSIDPIIKRLREGVTKTKDPVRIETNPANSANGLVWLMLLLPTILFWDSSI